MKIEVKNEKNNKELLNIKKYIKEILPAIIIAFTLSFMFFIYEPITLYLSNINDFWFDIYTLFSHSFIAFLTLFLILYLIYTIVYLLQKLIFKRFKKINIYKISLIISFVLLIITYIQGNYLAGKLPLLDGKIIEWDTYKTQNIISIILLLVISIIAIICVKKFNSNKTIKYGKNISLVICIMLIISLTTTCLTNQNGFKRKKYTVATTTNNINTYSSKNNLIIFLLDMLDSETLENIIKDNDEYAKVFEDFTYYPDTVGGYPFTDYSVPLILSGKWNELKTDFNTFYNEAMDNSKLLDYLREDDYNINIYSSTINYNTEKAKDIKNFSFDNKSDRLMFIKQEGKYILFKYLPFYLKKYSKIETMDFNITKVIENDELFTWYYSDFMNHLEQKAEMSKDNEFKYIHLEGGHDPFDRDKDLNKIEKGTYFEKVEASIKIVDKYLTYLKENNVFDNSAIIIMADHGRIFGWDDEATLKAQNPMLYIKGINEKHERYISDEKVSYDNLQDIYKELLNGKKTDTLFDNIDTSKPRRFMLQRIGTTDHLEEFMQNGYTKDLNTLEKTGNVYDLEVK